MGNGYKFTNVNANKCLDVYENSRDNGGNIILWMDTGAPNQRWDIQNASDGYVFIKSKFSGLALDVEKKSKDDGANVIQYNGNGGANQQWKLVPA
jgi:hypothetical protein